MGWTSGQLLCFMPLSVRSRPGLEADCQRRRNSATDASSVAAHFSTRLTLTREDALADLADHREVVASVELVVGLMACGSEMQLGGLARKVISRISRPPQAPTAAAASRTSARPGMLMTGRLACRCGGGCTEAATGLDHLASVGLLQRQGIRAPALQQFDPNPTIHVTHRSRRGEAITISP